MLQKVHSSSAFVGNNTLGSIRILSVKSEQNKLQSWNSLQIIGNTYKYIFCNVLLYII